MSDRVYWFPAKRYGWGWGTPKVWQGQAVLAAFFILLIAGGALLIPTRGELFFLGYAVALCVILMVVCWLKGEPPRWRWGDK
jgi:hypothetical protein